MEENAKFYTVRGYQLLQQNRKLLTPAMEDYMEMIYRNDLVEGYIRISTLSKLLHVAAPSASKMVQKLNDLGLLNYKKYGIIFLTENGRKLGQFLLFRHNVIESFLMNIGVKDNILDETELIEHNINIATLQKMNIFNKFLEHSPDVILKYELFSNTTDSEI